MFLDRSLHLGIQQRVCCPEQKCLQLTVHVNVPYYTHRCECMIFRLVWLLGIISFEVEMWAFFIVLFPFKVFIFIRWIAGINHLEGSRVRRRLFSVLLNGFCYKHGSRIVLLLVEEKRIIEDDFLCYVRIFVYPLLLYSIDSSRVPILLN